MERAYRKSPKSIPITVRFWKYVSPEPNSGCWLWEGSVDKRGYGQIRSHNSGPGSLRYATHISLEIHDRKLPPGMNACHKCDIPLCVNPDHLFHGTQKDNSADSWAKGRASKPPPSVKGRQKLTTHCPFGHQMAGINLYIAPSGARMCRTCRTIYKGALRKRRKDQGLTSKGTPFKCQKITENGVSNLLPTDS